MNRIIRYYQYALLVILTSCHDEEFLNYQLPKPPHWMGISGYICEDSTCVTLTKNHIWSTAYKPDSSIYITDAVVILYENGIVADTLRLTTHSTEDSYEVQYYYLSHKGGQVGKKYRIEAHHPQWPLAWAETYMPSPPQCTIDTTLTITKGYSYNENGYDSTNIITGYIIDIIVTLKDINAQPDFFQLRDEYVFIRANPVFENSYLKSDNSVFWPLFSDQMFSNKSITINATAWLKPEETGMLTIISLSEEGYRYFLSKSKYEHSRYDFSSQPVDIFSNVKNGFGIFYGISSQKFMIKP